MDEDQAQEPITWTAKVPIIDSVILKQIVFAVFLASLFVLIILLVIDYRNYLDYLLVFAGLFSFLLILLGVSAGVLHLITRGGFMTEFKVDKVGVYSEQGKTSQKLGQLAIIGGILGIPAGNRSAGMTTAGAGLISRSRESEFMGWTEMRNAVIYRDKRMIQVNRKSRFTPMLLKCTPDNFDTVSHYIRTKVDNIILK
ncbi:hypothetical protein D5R95_07700 [Methanosalsum natronophilum]|uniref:Uncharacterized protein n=1 Tax=Methanosalsum natronophilum TaxID=768733 RepID=A0A424YSR2_9EURY|nr:MAG: hypothetical protein D5R95_07700 [Methanosalsum natronophilum]